MELNQRTADVLIWTPIVLVFPIAGWLVGWLVGASNSPVVSTVLPLVFGVLGAAGYGALEKYFQRHAVSTVAPANSTNVGGLDNLRRRPLLVALSSTGVILFSITCFAGLRSGMSERHPAYRPLAELVSVKDIDTESLSVLYRIRWMLQALDVPPTEAESYFMDVIATALREKDPVIRYSALEQAAGSLIAAPKYERGLAHEDPPIPSGDRAPG